MSLEMTDKQLERAAMAALLRARLRLWLGSFDGVRRKLGAVPSGKVGGGDDAERVGLAVEAVSRRMPFMGNCLVRALAGLELLRRFGLPGELKIGVAREDRRGFEAHAWVELDGRVLIGAGEKDRFTPLEAISGGESTED